MHSLSMNTPAMNAWLGHMHSMYKKKGVTFEMHTLTHGCLCSDMSPFSQRFVRLSLFFDCQKIGACNITFSFFPGNHLMHMLIQSFDMRFDFAFVCKMHAS